MSRFVNWWESEATRMQAWERYPTPTHAARHLGGISERQARRLASMDAESAKSSDTETTAPSDPIEVVSLKRRIDRLEQEKKDLSAQLKAGIRHANMIDDVAALIAPAIDEYPNILQRIESRKIGKLPHRRTPVEMIIYLTDWHIGEVITREQTQGRNEYDVDVAARRAEHMALVTNEWLENYQHLHGVSRITYALLGDMVNNAHTLHGEQSVDASRVLCQALDASLIAYQAIRATLGSGVKHRIVATRGGNHGRSTRKMPSGRAAAESSWDGVVYEHLGAMLAASGIEWNLSRSYSATIDIAGRKLWLAHGDAIKGGGGQLGIPAYGAKRQSDTAVIASVLEAIESGDTDRIVQGVRVGHFHEETLMTMPTGKFKICPSLKGPSAWEMDSIGKISNPETLLETFHPEYGIIGSHTIDCSKPHGDGFVHGALGSLEPAALLAIGG
jgi:hypothetical protein